MKSVLFNNYVLSTKDVIIFQYNNIIYVSPANKARAPLATENEVLSLLWYIYVNRLVCSVRKGKLLIRGNTESTETQRKMPKDKTKTMISFCTRNPETSCAVRNNINVLTSVTIVVCRKFLSNRNCYQFLLIKPFSSYLWKTFDRVPREVVQWAMKKLGVTG